jgi:hypothetical protein
MPFSFTVWVDDRLDDPDTNQLEPEVAEPIQRPMERCRVREFGPKCGTAVAQDDIEILEGPDNCGNGFPEERDFIGSGHHLSLDTPRWCCFHAGSCSPAWLSSPSGG